MQRLLLLLCLLPVAACDDGDGTAPPPPPPLDQGVIDMQVDQATRICEVDRRRCTDDGVEICLGDQWRILGPCADGTTCTDGECVPDECVPDCNGRICGADGCGDTCGDCDAGWTCNMDGRCDPPAPRCGDDACNGDEDCTTCPADCGSCCGNGTCNAEQGENCATCLADCACEDDARCNAESGQCMACQPQCDGRECGTDGCGGTCGMCPGGAACENGICAIECMPMCDGRSCGADGCGGECGACDGDQVCNADGQCEAPPARCGDMVCGDGEDCGNCPADCGACCGNGECSDGETCSTCPADCGCPDGEACNVQQARCVPECVPQCDGRNCGDDGCGGVCGNCLENQDCEAGVCRDRCEPVCDGRECGGDGCGGTCGECDAGEQCTDGTCEVICSPNCDDRACGGDGCGGFCGACDVGEVCTEAGQCDAVCERNCDGRVCGADGCGGTCGDCGDGTECNDAGQCIGLCAPDCDGRACGPDGCGGECGMCAMGAICADGGVCIGGGDLCDCQGDDICLDGVCRAPEQLCDADTPNGLCPSGRACVAGACELNAAGCSPANPTGQCPLGEVCRDGGCVEFDGAALCEDANACTRDLYDNQANRCVNVPVQGACDDGNACTADMCVDGACVGEPILGCVEPPRVDAVQSPTNVGDLTLRGDKPAGASILVNGEEAVPESPDEAWSIEVQLQPGENVFEIRSNDMGEQSEAVTVRVVYDIEAPTLQLNPAGGVFLDAITVQVTSDEPATVYYTDDGGTPDRWSKSFRSVKRFRIFNSTQLRFRALDDAGNWQDDIVDARYEISGENNAWIASAPLPEPVSLAAAVVVNQQVTLMGGTDGLAAQAGVWRMSTAGEEAGVWAAGPALDLARAQASGVNIGNDIYLVGGENDGIPLNLLQRLRDNAWQNLAPMPTTRFGAAGAVINGTIYVFGGKTNGGAVLDRLEAYNPGQNAWTNQVAQMPRPRYGHAAVVVEDEVYLVGGETEEGALIAEVDVYRPATDQWRQIAPLPTPRSFVTASIDHNRGAIDGPDVNVVVSGGRLADGAPTAVVESFVVGAEHWRTRTPLPAPRHSSAGVYSTWADPIDQTINRSLVIGGLVADALSADVRGLEIRQDYIRRKVDLPEGRFAHAAVENNGSFYIFGGRNFQGTDEFWQYDPETGRTTPLPPLPSVQNGLSGVEHNGLIYAIGGANQFNLSVPTLRVFDPATREWSDLPPMQTGRAEMATVVVDDEIWTIGGTNNGALPSVEIYTPATGEWRAGPVLPAGLSGASALNRDGVIEVLGGVGANGALTNAWLRLVNGVWQVQDVAVPLSHAQAVAVHDRHAVVLGGRNADGPSAQIIKINLLAGRPESALTPSTTRLPALDRAVVISHHGVLYIVGGNATPEIGPEGARSVYGLAAHCFDGQFNAGEEVQLEVRYDVGGACPDAVPPANGTMRIEGNRLNREGLLEVFFNGRWGIVCDDGFDQNEVRVACDGIFGVRNGSFRNQNSRRNDFLLDDLACRGNEASLLDCPNRGVNSHNCGSTETVYLTCRP